MNLDQLTERIRQTLDRSGAIFGDWSETDQLARTIAIDIDREESADVTVTYDDDGNAERVTCNGIAVDIENESLRLPVGLTGEIMRDDLPRLLACLNHIQRTGIR